MTKETKDWWEQSSEGYQRSCKIPADIHYGPGAPNEQKLKLLGNLKGKKVLEIGCGGAQCGIAMAKKGAKVTGIDISEEQLKFAEKLAKKNKVKIKFIQGDIKSLKQIKSNSQDVVFTAWALHYVDDLKKCFKEVFRVLKKKGQFVAALPHPFYFIIDNNTLKFKRSYFKTGKNIEKHKKGNFVSYDHTVSELFNLLSDSGLDVKKIIEPDSRKRYPEDPWYGIWEFTPKLMKLIPSTIIFKAIKK